jgi:MoxR-like ATPase
MDPTDLLGLPQVKDGRVVYAPPALLPTAGRGLLLLEELNRAPAMTRTPALELLTRRRLHEYVLPPAWLPCAAINPAGDGYVVDTLDPALLSRFVLVDVEPDRLQWLQWARRRGLNDSLLAFVDAAPDLFEADSVNPRALEYASRLIAAVDGANHGEAERVEILAAGLAGLLGQNVATGLLRFMAGAMAPFKADEILDDYDASRPSVQRWIAEGRVDLVQATVKKLQQHLEQQKAWDGVQKNLKQRRNLARFRRDLPPDLRRRFESWMEQRGYADQKRKAS